MFYGQVNRLHSLVRVESEANSYLSLASRLSVKAEINRNSYMGLFLGHIFSVRVFLASTALVTLSLHAARAGAVAPEISAQCNEPFRAISADDSESKEYFKKLLKRGMDAPLDDFMHLWYPDRKQAVDQDSHMNKCKTEGYCRLDTLYSWGPVEKLKAMQAKLPDNGIWSGEPNPGHALDTVPSAIGSYAYGPIPVRIKIDPDSSILGVNFNAEHVVSNAKTIKSWSFGTPEHYDEIVRDYKRYQERLSSGKFWRGYALREASVRPGTSDTPLFTLGELDGHEWSEKALKSSLLKMIEMILNGEGRIYYARNTCRSRKRAFETKFPTYINPFPEGNSLSFDLERPQQSIEVISDPLDDEDDMEIPAK